jgi:geranylgeranyl diphosphate synthase type II
MVGGQTVDVQWEGKTVDVSLVEFIHTHKTAALIEASVTSGAVLGGGAASQLRDMAAYGRNIGLAFQISDDILDIEGDSEAMGKKAGADQKRNKITFPSVVGLRESKELQARLIASAVESLRMFDNRADPLREIAHYIVTREK